MSRKTVKDEFLEHREGQEIFTARRVVFAVVLVGVALAVGLWVMVGEPS